MLELKFKNEEEKLDEPKKKKKKKLLVHQGRVNQTPKNRCSLFDYLGCSGKNELKKFNENKFWI